MIYDYSYGAASFHPTLKSFIVDNALIFCCSMTVSALLFGVWFYLYNWQRQVHYKKVWLSENQDLIRSEVIMPQLLRMLKNEINGCSRCAHPTMQIWDYSENLLVVRCCTCKMNHTYSAKSPLKKQLINLLDHRNRMESMARKQRFRLLGRHLSRHLSNSGVGEHGVTAGNFIFDAGT